MGVWTSRDQRKNWNFFQGHTRFSKTLRMWKCTEFLQEITGNHATAKKAYWFNSLYSNEHLKRAAYKVPVPSKATRSLKSKWQEQATQARIFSRLYVTTDYRWILPKVCSEQNDITPLHPQFPPLSYTWRTWNNMNLKTQWSSPLKMASWTSKPPNPKCSYLAMGFPVLSNRYTDPSVQL